MNKGPISRAAGIAVLAFLLVIGSFLVVMPESADAALGGLTGFEIDGDVVASGGVDWQSLPNSAGVFDPGEVLVINDQNFTGAQLVTDPSTAANTYCIGGDDLIVKNGTKLTDFPFVAVDGSPAPGKNDICQTYVAYDVVPNAGVNEIVLYVGVIRRETNGTTAVAVELNRIDQAHRQSGDLVISFEFDGNGPVAVVNIREWNGSGFDLTAVGGTSAAEGYSTDHFGEIAVNLTATGILPPPENPEDCSTLGTVLPFGWAGNSDTSNIGDWGGSAPLGLDLCGKLIIEKQTNPTGSTETFGYSLSTSAPFSPLTGSLIGDGDSFEWLLPDGNYTLVEADPFGLGWAFDNYSCNNGASSEDRAAGVTVPVSLGTTITCTIENVQPAISVTKTADPTSVPETGGDVTFTFRVDNTGPEAVSLTDLVDSVFGDLDGQGSCVLPQDLSIGGFYECSLTVFLDSDDLVDHFDEVTATAFDAAGLTATATDDATVTFNDLLPTVGLTKSAVPSSLPEPGGDFVFTLTITNTSVEPVTITDLSDSQSGATDFSACSALVGSVLAVDATVECEYTVAHSEAGSYDNTASVTVEDNDGNSASDEAAETVTVVDVLPTVELAKSAVPSSLPEPGGDFVFTLTITNTSVEPVTITDLSDSQSGATDFSACSALVGSVLAVDATVECEYTVAHSEAGSYDNTASVTVEDNDGNSASDEAAETVTVVDVRPSVDLVKDASPGSLPEPGGDFTFTLTIYNTTVEPVQVTALSDDYTLPAGCTGLVGQWIPVGGNLSCSYTVTHTDAGSYDNTASVTVEDNEGNPASDTDDETVTVTDTPIAISIQKTADPLFLNEPGGTFTYTLTITNPSQEAVEIKALTDSNALSADCLNLIGETLNPAGDEGDSVSCTYTVDHTTPGVYDNVATVVVMDNEENEATDDDDASVSVLDVPSSILVTKTPGVTQIAEPGGTVTFTVVVENTSETDMLIVASLVDDVYGDLNGQGNCTVPQKLAVGESYTCSFDGEVLGNAGDSHVNVVTVTAEDDDGNFIEDDDDATVNVTDVASGISVTKTADQPAVQEPGGTVTFTVVVQNPSAADSVTITSMVDDVFGDLNGLGTCSVPQELAPGASYTCSFDGEVAGEAGSSADPHVNTVTVVGIDDDENEVTDSDDETVDITEKPTGTIGDFVWNDTSEDGIQDADEVGVEGVLVELVDADTGEVIASMTTGADGAYEFSGVEEGDYFVRFTTPKSWEFGLVDAGDDDSVDSDAVFKSGSGEKQEHFEIAETLPFSLAAGETNTSFDAGMIKIFVSPQVITTTTTTTTVATTTISTLPFTGFGQGDVAGTALVLIVLGGFVLLAMRRRDDLLETAAAEAPHPAWDE
ncbi:MAG: SdrD B-like domain-containing protein [Acidimicrobiia bacterium]|nr:SdrD B-like domain-containing protein [Acidimicrobiia bacterium]